MPVFEDGELEATDIDHDDYYTRFAERRNGLQRSSVSGHDHSFVIRGFDTSQGVSPCPKCNKYYKPEEDSQIFCDDCQSWFHIECCFAAGGVYAAGEGVELADRIEQGPLIRGYFDGGLLRAMVNDPSTFLEGVVEKLRNGEHVKEEEYSEVLAAWDELDRCECPRCGNTIRGT